MAATQALTRILSFRDSSPLILLIDTILQSALPLLQHFEKCARSASVRLITVGWQTTSDVCTTTQDDMKPLDRIITEVATLCESVPASTKILISIRDLNDFMLTQSTHLARFLSSLLSLRPTGLVSVLCIFHSDVPTPTYPAHLPAALPLLSFMATTIINVHSKRHDEWDQEADAQSRTSRVVLDMEAPNVVVPLGSNDGELVCLVEVRRKSGRGVTELSLFSSLTGTTQPLTLPPSSSSLALPPAGPGDAIDESVLGFKISLSDREREVRDGLVLPHFKAQDGYHLPTHNGADPTTQNTTGGMIYYEPDSGDDFDEEDPDDDLML